ncbi:hypothetical protein ACFVT1_35815 [Streptomyces sp. NPDC057963]|uniref:hypothetical protein n=1 Tax=Streptomyces sp. NPDC057963 TaxID=3346290 RepID=UPI0036E334A1
MNSPTSDHHTGHGLKTLAVTAEREFLRYKKVTADGRRAEVDPSDLYDLLHLDQRADRVLPNGWCMLPPKQVCSKGNACLTCDKFVTDASHRDELQHQLERSQALVARRQAQFTARPARAGQEMRRLVKPSWMRDL